MPYLITTVPVFYSRTSTQFVLKTFEEARIKYQEQLTKNYWSSVSCYKTGSVNPNRKRLMGKNYVYRGDQ